MSQSSTMRVVPWQAPLFIVILAAALRLPLLGTIPNGFYADEASTGYDAYSLLETEKDQYGESWPLFERSFGDYVESLYRFLVVPSVGLFGLNPFATRFPAALAGIFTVYLLYLLVREWYSERFAVIATILMVISPWHVQFSRCGFRGILFPLFLCLGLLFFFWGLKNHSRLPFSAVAFATGLWIYSSARVFIPAFVLILTLIYWDEFRKARRWVVGSAAIFSAVLVYLGLFWISPEGMARARASLTCNQWQILSDYFSYFSPGFLFLER